jgi:hypothetical protein
LGPRDQQLTFGLARSGVVSGLVGRRSDTAAIVQLGGPLAAGLNSRRETGRRQAFIGRSVLGERQNPIRTWPQLSNQKQTQIVGVSRER